MRNINQNSQDSQNRTKISPQTLIHFQGEECISNFNRAPRGS